MQSIITKLPPKQIGCHDKKPSDNNVGDVHWRAISVTKVIREIDVSMEFFEMN